MRWYIFITLYLGIGELAGRYSCCIFFFTLQVHLCDGAARVQGVAMALLVLATWLLMWFSDVCGSGLLSAHYTHFRLRLRSQLGLLLQRRRTWLVVSAIVALDSFCISLNTSYVYQMPNVRPANHHCQAHDGRFVGDFVMCCVMGIHHNVPGCFCMQSEAVHIDTCLLHVLDAQCAPCLSPLINVMVDDLLADLSRAELVGIHFCLLAVSVCTEAVQNCHGFASYVGCLAWLCLLDGQFPALCTDSHPKRMQASWQTYLLLRTKTQSTHAAWLEACPHVDA